jgi:hypothetical protein
VTRPVRLALHFSLTLALLAAAAPAAADLPPPGGLFDLVGPRTLGVSAGTAGTTGSEAIFVNPAAIGIRTGFVAEAMGVQERRGADTLSRYLGGVVIDGVSSPVAAGFGYFRSMEGPQTGNINYLTLAGPLAERLHVGLQGRYMKLGGVEPINAITLDAGINFEATSLVTLGVAGFNLVPTAHPALLPQAMGAGLAIGSDTSFRVLADWKGTWLPHGQLANRYAAGADALLGGMVVVRAGWKRDELLATSWWSAGLGLVTGDGFAIDVGYKQSFEASSAREMGLSLRYYPPQ